jgi:hypothetical protein
MHGQKNIKLAEHSSKWSQQAENGPHLQLSKLCPHLHTLCINHASQKHLQIYSQICQPMSSFEVSKPFHWHMRDNTSRQPLLNLIIIILLYLLFLLLILFLLLLRMFTYCPQSNNFVFFCSPSPCNHKVANGRHGPHTDTANASKLNEVSQTADRRWSFRSDLVARVTTRHSKKIDCYIELRVWKGFFRQNTCSSLVTDCRIKSRKIQR